MPKIISPFGGAGAGYIVGCHEEGTQEQAAGEDLIEHPSEDVHALGSPREDQGQHGHGEDVGQGIRIRITFLAIR